MRHIRYVFLLSLVSLASALCLVFPARASGTPSDENYGISYGLFSGTRVCDAVNRDGYCIAWHANLRDAVYTPGQRCDAFECDLTGRNRRLQRHRRRVIQEPIEVTPLEPKVMEFDSQHPFDPHAAAQPAKE